MGAYNSPFKTEQYFTNQENFLIGCKKDDEQEASHNAKSAKNNFLWPEGCDEPTVDQSTEN